MRPDPLVPAFYYYKFADAISAPYTSLSAYSSGVIDSSGHIIKPESSIDPFEYFVIKLKKIFEQLPYGTTKASLASYIPALQMFSEEAQDYGMESEHFNYFVEGMVASESNGELSYLELVEEMGSANLGGPATSNNTGGVSGYDPPMQKGVMKRKSILGFENSCEMFDVCPDDYEGIKSAKAWRHVPESESKSYLQRYQRRNGKGKMAIRNSDTGEVHFISMKPQSFMEEYGLEGLDILNEDFTQTTGQKSLNTAATAQYGAISHFLDNHVRNLHDHSDHDDLEINVEGSDKPVKMKMGSANSSNNFRSYLNNTINSTHSEENKKSSSIKMSIKTKNGIIKTTIPHVSAHNTPDLTIEDSHVSEHPIKIDTKGARGRWEDKSGKFQDDNKKPVKVPVSEFDTGTPDKNNFVVLHDNTGEVKYVDHSHMPNVKKLLSKVYVKSGSSTRPGKFAMIGEIPLRLSHRGIVKSVLRNLDTTSKDSDTVLRSSSQKNFAHKFAELTNTTFGHNDMYTSLFRKKK